MIKIKYYIPRKFGNRIMLQEIKTLVVKNFNRKLYSNIVRIAFRSGQGVRIPEDDTHASLAAVVDMSIIQKMEEANA